MTPYRSGHVGRSLAFALEADREERMFKSCLGDPDCTRRRVAVLQMPSNRLKHTRRELVA